MQTVEGSATVRVPRISLFYSAFASSRRKSSRSHVSCCVSFSRLLSHSPHSSVCVAQVTAIQFSPDSKFFAVSHGAHVQVWRTPELVCQFAPFTLHREYTGHYADVTCITWSHDGRCVRRGVNQREGHCLLVLSLQCTADGREKRWLTRES